MAVKQNNTDANATATATGGSNVVGSASAGSGGKSSATGTKAKKMNPNVNGSGGGGGGGGVGGSGSNELPGCSGAAGGGGAGGASAKPKKISSNVGGVGGAAVNGSMANALSPKSTDIAYILQLIELVEMKQQQVDLGQEILKIYQHLLMRLAHVSIPRQSPEDLKRFKEDIAKVGAFFAKASEKNVYMFYLHVVCQLITLAEGEAPSCALAVIFQLFSSDMVFEAVQSLLDHKIPDQNIRKTVRLLCEWLRICNFCQNLNLWIMAILSGLQEQQKLVLFDEIALENIEQLFTSLMLPVLRPKVAPIVFHMLSSINHSPQVFHKILPKFPRVVGALKQQSNSVEEYAESTKKFLQQLVDRTSALMVRFYGYDDLYEPIELALKDFQPSLNYLNYASVTQSPDGGGGGIGDFGNDAILQNTNAKVGLVNLGNTCYMNSVLQALAMTKEFSREILLSNSKSPLLIKMQQQIALMLYSKRYELTPSRVLNATRPPGFSPGLQQDSSEFLGYLLETLHEQEVAFCKRSPNNPIATAPEPAPEPEPASDAIDPTAKSGKHCETEAEAETEDGASALCGRHDVSDDSQVVGQTNTDISSGSNGSRSVRSNTVHSTEASDANVKSTNLRQPPPSPPPPEQAGKATSSPINVICNSLARSTIEKTFTGQLATTYKCLTCGWKSRNVDSFRDLQLSFPDVKNDCASNYSVQDLLEYYCSPEKLYGDNQYFCERCKKLSDAERYINVISAPKNLILTLKHFKYDQKYHMRAKLMHKVFHDEKVSVKVCATESLDEIATVHYDLYAGVVHSGFSMDSGHYYTYAADSSNKWYKFNDSIVTPSKTEELHNLTPPNTPYILFYQMGARSNEAPEASASTKVVKVDVPIPLTLDELPRDLRDYVNHDNYVFSEELKLRRFRNANITALQNALKAKEGGGGGSGGSGGGGRDSFDDDEDQPPPPASGCGGNAMNINMNRFVY